MLGWLRWLIVLALVASACSESEGPAAQATTSSQPSSTGVATTIPTTASTTTTTTSTTTASTTTTALPTTAAATITSTPLTLPSPELFEPSPTDVLLEQKRLAGRFVQSILTHAVDETSESVTQRLIAEFDPVNTEELQALVGEVVQPGTKASGTIVYGQMGGLRPDSASVMVQAQQDMLTTSGDAIVTETRVFDVRMVNLEGIWRINFLASNGGPHVDRPTDLTAAAIRVLDHPNIHLADSSRWDIYRGHTTEEMLLRMAEIADVVEISVLVLSSGHPINVFSTEKLSRHSVGNAMDVYAVGGMRVVDSRFEGSPAWDLTNRLFEAETRSIGSPWSLDGFGGRSFSDLVHQDHLHIIAN